MSRHRSPGGRQQSGLAASPRRRAAVSVRHGLQAAVAGGALAGALGNADVLLVKAHAEVAMVASIAPVRETPVPVPPEVTATTLIKAAGLAEVARKAEELRAARRAAAGCDDEPRGLGPVKPWAREASRFLSCLYDHPTLIGVSLRGGVSDHPTGHAVDFMASGERGDRIAQCALANQAALGISYVIWKQRINYGNGWEPMADRGSITENHYDHVHVSFEKRPPGGVPDPGRCG